MFRPLPVMTAAALAALAVLIGLGVWQLQRRAEKHALLEQIAQRTEAAPAPVEILLATGDFAAHRAAIAQGTFDHAREHYVYAPRTDGGPTRPGKKVVTPFNLVSGGTILVDRGWIEEDSPLVGIVEPDGEVAVEGVLRPSSSQSTFTPPPDLPKRLFFVRDSAAIAEAAGVDLRTMLILEATVRLGRPEPISAKLNIPDNHLNYALTWFSLGLVLVVIYLRYHYVRGRLKFSR